MQLPVTIKKSWFGYFVIALSGFIAFSLIWVSIISLWRAHQLDEGNYYLFGGVSILVLVATLVQLYVYSISYISLTSDRLKAEHWTTLFSQVDVDTEWVRVQDVTVETGSIFALLFGYGTLTIQAAGTAQQLKMTYVPNVEYWQSVIQALADQSTGEDSVDLSTVDLANVQ